MDIVSTNSAIAPALIIAEWDKRFELIFANDAKETELIIAKQTPTFKIIINAFTE